MSIATGTVQPHDRMKRARLFAGLDQEQMSALLGKSRNTVSAWERGVNEPSVMDVARWAQVTGRTIDWIVWGDDVRPKGVEPLTFWLGVGEWTPEDEALYRAEVAACMLPNQPDGSRS